VSMRTRGGIIDVSSLELFGIVGIFGRSAQRV